MLFVMLIVKSINTVCASDRNNSAKENEPAAAVSTPSSETSSIKPQQTTKYDLTVCIDPGHGDYDPGTVNSDQTRLEKDDDLRISLKIRDCLEKQGVNVVMTRSDDTFVELEDRTKIANNAKCDFFVCMHRNAYIGDMRGVEVWVNNAEPKEEKPAEAKEDKQQDAQGEEHQAPEQTYEIKVNGETRKVTMKELTDLAQMGADYTKKTQALAESRRQVDAMMAALQVQKASQPQQTQPQPQDNPVDRVKSDYEQAVRETEQRLRLKPGEFNQFDPMHQFALHRVMSEHEAQQARYAARMSDVQTEIQDFLAEANKDPDTQAINDNFNRYLFAMGASSAEGAEKAQRIANAENALFSKTATREDCKVLRAHWKYVKEQLAKEKAAQQAQAAPKPEPPKTETPGNGRQAQTHAVFDMHKLGSMNTQQQLRALKQLGIFNMKG